MYFKRSMLSMSVALACFGAHAADYYVVVHVPGKTVNASAIGVALTQSTLPSAVVGTAYSYNFNQNLLVTGDTTYVGYGVKWSVDSGSLPAGLALNASTGILSGTPTGNGTSSFVLTATYKTKAGTQSFQIPVTLAVSVALANATPALAVVGATYSYDLKPLLTVSGDNAYNGTGVTWSVVSSTLPAGLSLRTDGTIAGTPTVTGSGTITAQASYKGVVGSRSYSIQAVQPTYTGSLTADTNADFGTVPINSSATRTFTFKNTGNSQLTGIYPTITGDGLSIDAATTSCGTLSAPVKLSPTSTCSVQVRYSPTALSALSGASVAVGNYASLGVAGSGVAQADPFYSNVTFLMHADTSFGDSSLANVGVAATGVSVSGAAKFGSGGAYFGGASYLAATSGLSGFDMNTSSAWTVEGWINADSTKNGGSYLHRFFSVARDATNSEAIAIGVIGGTLKAFVSSSPTTQIGTLTGTFSTNTWTHYAFVFTGSQYQLYLNGTLAGSMSSTTKAYGTIGSVFLGQENNQSTGTRFTGYLDDVRVTKGIARYTSNFSAPAQAFTNY